MTGLPFLGLIFHSCPRMVNGTSEARLNEGAKTF